VKQRFRRITAARGEGHQPKGACPSCGAAVVKGTADIGRGRKLAYMCVNMHIGEWDSRRMPS